MPTCCGCTIFPTPLLTVRPAKPTTTPLQQLFVLNSPLLHQRSIALAARLDREGPASADVEARVNWLYDKSAGPRRRPTDELALARDFFAASQGVASAEAWRQYSQALLASNELLFVE